MSFFQCGVTCTADFDQYACHTSTETFAEQHEVISKQSNFSDIRCKQWKSRTSSMDSAVLCWAMLWCAMLCCAVPPPEGSRCRAWLQLLGHCSRETPVASQSPHVALLSRHVASRGLDLIGVLSTVYMYIKSAVCVTPIRKKKTCRSRV